MGIDRFEELAVWQRARALSVRIYGISARGRFDRDFGFRDQIRRAAVSVMSNIAEGFERYSRSEFRHFLSVARGSVAEVRSQLYLALDLGYVDPGEGRHLIQECEEIGRMLGALRATVKD